MTRYMIQRADGTLHWQIFDWMSLAIWYAISQGFRGYTVIPVRI